MSARVAAPAAAGPAVAIGGAGRSASRPRATVASRPDSAVLRLVAFACLASFGAVEWAHFLLHPPTGRALALAGIATASAAALVGLGRVRMPRRRGARAARAIACVAVVLAAAAVAALVAGVPARLLVPSAWGRLTDGIDRGLTGAANTGWPYTGDDPWVARTLLLGIPVLALPAAALAFWPAGAPRRVRSARGLGSVAGLALLIALYAIPATERTAGRPVLNGLALLVLAGAWLWLPRLRGRELAPALAAMGLAAAVALPVAGALRDHQPWVDYTRWNLFVGHAGGHTFDWTHRYGPLSWSREGATMLQVSSPHPHYWKAETLDRFDGLRWSHSGAASNSQPTAELPQGRNPKWDERIRFTIRGLRTTDLIAAGTVYSVKSEDLMAGSGDGTIRLVDGPMREGESYTVQTYVPDPTAAQMRAAPRRFPTQFLSYTYVDLPSRHDSALTSGPPAEGVGNVTSRTVGAAFPGEPLGADRPVLRRVLASPYARDYRLARRLATGQRTTYDVVRSVERYLQKGFAYTERPPLRRFPLDAFLFRDRAGYCQQFSGAMALLLRLDGIPTRVAAGFAPGIPDPATGEYLVRDLDAHSWVEVWFSGIGWVPFDPTPSLAPAAAQATSDSLASAATGGHETGADARGNRAPRPGGAGLGGDGGGGDRALLVVGVLIALGAAGLAGLWAAAVVRARRVRAAGGDPDVRELRWALERLGHPVQPRTTLTQLERRLRVTAGEDASGYVRALRDRRYAGRERAGQPRLDRRALRRALVRGRGPIVKARALLVLPPRRGEAAS